MMYFLEIILWLLLFLLGVRPFACPHCDKKFRTSGHRKTHIASHFKHSELRKMRHQRKPAKVRVGKASAPVPDIPLQEPILITDVGKVLFPLGPLKAYVMLCMVTAFCSFRLVLVKLQNKFAVLTKLCCIMGWCITYLEFKS